MRLSGRRGWWAIAAAVLIAVVTAVGVLVATGGEDDTPPQARGTTSPVPSTSAAPTSAGATTTSPETTTQEPGTPAPTAPTTAAPVAVPPALRGQDLTVLPTSQRVVALTFDAGANAAALPSILATLAREGVRATFFLTGRWAAANPAGVTAIGAGGHRIGNHSMTHPAFTGLSDAAVSEEVLAGQQAILAAGADPRPLFRFPSGDRDARTIAAVNADGYVAVRWTVDTLGWQGISGGRSAQEVTDRALAGLRPGEIVLMHIGSNPDDGSTLDADALPDMIARMRAAGYGFVTLDALFG
ncbi:Peptidoglycan/xylan/chitin deacetylase, PgdA/CDA1 family [Blastococcus aggregatus]|uniref:Peptidoglycan/xylan/chitin deacetylase, PgdA/CDA1 family n=1 Tax=Blastococcus aggregatus TaxID=38502 RepID=A0A285V5Y1_9ACTN|nr:polysaccharide deacetylase family protein [Blastococcus aggregatus]SOC49532.1 Peptidoglycan/xylan/chitin deacetylase, PgdA/CDA1 family [Blastococcus aggregatus]